MSNEISIELQFPLVVNHLSVKYSETEKPSGLGYMLLKMIGSDAVSEKMTFENIIHEFGLPKDVFQIFVSELKELSAKEMIHFNDPVTLKSSASSISFTKLGKEAFSKGVISITPQDLSTDIYFAPGKGGVKFYHSADNFKKSEVREDFFDEVNVNADDLENFIKSDKSKSHLGINVKNDIFDFRLISSDMSGYDQKVSLDFDRNNASFSLRDGDMDINFIKSRYSFDSIASLLNPNLFETAAVTLRKRGGSDIPWDTYEFMLPENFGIQNADLCFFDSEYCSVSENHGFSGNLLNAPESLKKINANAVIISSSNSFAYRFIVGKIQLKGFDGQTKKNLIVRRSLSAEEKNDCLKEAIKSVNINESGRLIECVRICRLMIDSESEIHDLIFAYFKDSPIRKYHSAVKELSGFKTEKWYNILPDIIEESLSKRPDLLKDWKSIADLLFSLSGENLRSEWRIVLPLLFSSDPASNLEIADYCLTKDLNRKIILRESGIADTMISSITNNKKIDGRSPFFTTVSNIRYNLAELQKLTGIMSVSEYSFDIHSLGEKTHEKIETHASAFQEFLNSFVSELSSLKLSSEADNKLSGIRDLNGIFQDIRVALKNLNKEVSEKGLRNERNPRLAGLSLGLKLEEIFKLLGFDGSLNDMISKAFESGHISESDFQTLNDIREFRNQCAHKLIIPTLDSSKKEKWIRLVFRLEPAKEVKK